jgi:RNA polymerase sigma factor (sigma-70 family)
VSDPFANPKPLIDRVYAYIAYVVGDPTIAEDVTSEAIARGLRYRASYDHRKGTPVAWLIGIARNCLPAAAPPFADEAALADVASAEDVELEALDRLTLRTAVASLPARDRELIALRYGSDLTARQIAGLLETTTNAVEVALHRALRRLRAELSVEPAEAPRKGLDLAGGM